MSRIYSYKIKYGCNVAVIRVNIKDDNGRVLTTANSLVKYSIEGPGKIIGTSNSNPPDTKRIKQPKGWLLMGIVWCWFNQIKPQERFV